MSHFSPETDVLDGLIAALIHLYLRDSRETLQPVVLNDNQTVLLMETLKRNQNNSNNKKDKKKKNSNQECTNSKHVIKKHFKRCFYTYIQPPPYIRNIYTCK